MKSKNRSLLYINLLLFGVVLFSPILAFICNYIEDNYGIAWALLFLFSSLMALANVAYLVIEKYYES